MYVSIRPYEQADATALQEAALESTREVFPWLPWCTPDHSIENAHAWIETQAEARVRGTAYEFVITSDGNTFLGGCGVNHIDATDRRANLGYWVRTAATGQGVAPRAVQTLVGWAFRNTDLERLEIVVAEKNVRSQRVVEKSGAHREGVAQSRLLLHGVFHDAVVYSITRSLWPAG